MSSAQKFKQLLKQKSKGSDPSVTKKWVQDVDDLYKIITEWLNYEGLENFIHAKTFDDPSIGKYESGILTIRAGGGEAAGGNEATIEPRYTMPSGREHGVQIVSGDGAGLRVRNLARMESNGEYFWSAQGALGSFEKVLSKDIFFDALIKVFRLEE